MIRFSVLYPKADGATFDHDYYRNSHVPLALKTWGVEQGQIDRGVNGPYEAAFHVLFESPDAMKAALGAPGGDALNADVPNYTTITPVIQISEIVD